MKQLVFATNNESKGKRFSEKLLEKGIEVKTLKDLNITLDIEEDGKTAIENALIKARACRKKVSLPVIGMDDTLYMEGVDEDNQPGLFVRRVGGKTLNDDEMIEHYTNLVKRFGHDGKIDCKWIYGLALIDMEGMEHTYSWSIDNFYMVETASIKRHVGYPLDSISKNKALNKYFVDITEEEKEEVKNDEKDVIDFICKCL